MFSTSDHNTASPLKANQATFKANLPASKSLQWLNGSLRVNAHSRQPPPIFRGYYTCNLLEQLAETKTETDIKLNYYPASHANSMKMIITGSYSLICKQIHVDWWEYTLSSVAIFFFLIDDCRGSSRGPKKKKITGLSGKPLSSKKFIFSTSLF